MTLSEAIRDRQGRRSVRANRSQQARVERRADEIAAVHEIDTDYRRVDRAGDLQMESWFQRAYQSAPSEEWRQMLVQGFQCWLRTERAEEGIVAGSVDEAVDVLRQNNGYWLNPDTESAA